MSKSFADLGLSEPTLRALRDVGYEAPSPIQEQAIPALLEWNGPAVASSIKTD